MMLSEKINRIREKIDPVRARAAPYAARMKGAVRAALPYSKYALGLLLLLLLIYSFIPDARLVDLVAVKRGDVVVAVESEGRTRIRDIYVVSAPVDGRLRRIELDPGDVVVAGETVIAAMTPADPQMLDRRAETQALADVRGAEAARARAAAQLTQAGAERDFAEAEFERTEELYRKGNASISARDEAALALERGRTTVAAAEAELRVMENRLAAARAQLIQPGAETDRDTEDPAAGASSATPCQLCIHAPVDGKLLRVIQESEAVLARGAPLVEVGDPHNLELVAEMLSRDAVRVRAGQRALVKHWGGERDLRARVRLVEPSGYTKISALGVEEQRVNVILDFVDSRDQWRTLGDAFRIEASVIVDQATDVLHVPISALFRDNGQWHAFVVRDGRARLQKLRVGRRNERLAEIREGLTLGDRVIVHPGNEISDGIRVARRE